MVMTIIVHYLQIPVYYLVLASIMIIVFSLIFENKMCVEIIYPLGKNEVSVFCRTWCNERAILPNFWVREMLIFFKNITADNYN